MAYLKMNFNKYMQLIIPHVHGHYTEICEEQQNRQTRYIKLN